MSLSDRHLDWKNLCVNKILFNVVYSHNNMLLTAKLVIFVCSVISQGKVVARDRWGGKWNHLLITHRLTTNYAKDYCNRTLIVKVIVENVVTCFSGHGVWQKWTTSMIWSRVWSMSGIYGLRQSVIGDSNDRRRRRLRTCIHDKMTFRAF